MVKVKHVISMSGGKDSLATRLVAIEKGIEHVAVFADTGNEHQITYDYLDYLREVTGPIVTVKADFARLFGVKSKTIDTKWKKEVLANIDEIGVLVCEW
jgi:3'-phosphoadenosine 5'-phosphosulfate sulfotransferase (PAPS reductase)/FAD synthetase